MVQHAFGSNVSRHATPCHASPRHASPRHASAAAVARGVAGGVAAIGVASLGYSLIEAHQFRLRLANVECLAAGSARLRLLHLSDLHLVPRQRDKMHWITGLAELLPDFVVATGDFLAHRRAVPAVLEALEPLLGLPGAFVLGSNDYYAPRLKNPLRYFAGPSDAKAGPPTLPWTDLVRGLTAGGWHDLSNATAGQVVRGVNIEMRGVDDPHIGRDDYALVGGPFPPDAGLRLGVTHAPYRRVIEAMANDGADLILAGHTHGGQVCLPGHGALVTNCDLDARRAKGLSRCGESWLHVSAGIGTSPFAPIRFACPPEATLLTLSARSDRPVGA